MKKNKIEFKVTLLVLKKIFAMLLRISKLYIFGLLFNSVVLSILPIITLLVTQELLNQIQLKNDFLTVFKTILLLIFIMIISLIFSTLYDYISYKYKEFLYYKINKEILEKTELFSLKDFENPNTYDLLQRAEKEGGIRPYNILMSIINILAAIITVVSSTLILFSWHWWTIIMFVVLPILSFHKLKKISENEYDVMYNRAKYERKSWYISHLLTKDTFIKEVKQLDLSRYFIKKFNNLRKTFYKENSMLFKKKSLFLFLFQFGTLLLNIFILIIGAKEALLGTILIGSFSTYINTLSKLDNSIKSITSSIFSLYQDSLYAKNIVDYLNEDLNNQNFLNHKEDMKIPIKKIEFCNVSYKYSSRNIYVLKDVSFTLNEYNKVALVGENGSGKSTLIKLLCGLYDDYEGNIYVNDINLKKFKIDNYKNEISCVFQDYNCYQFTIEDNIRFGDIKNLDYKSKVGQSAVLSDSIDFISMLPKQFLQQVGTWFEEGTQLSGGQWQKLAIARGFMRNASLYIFDEPTASLDPKSEMKFFKKFYDYSNESICIFTTHRFSNAQIADTIMVLKNGEIIERGNHIDLIKHKGEYYEMFKASKYFKFKK